MPTQSYSPCMEGWKELKSNVNKYVKKYEGYISSHDYKREDDSKLAQLVKKITRQTN